MRYLVGLIGMPLGIALIVYRERVKNFTGDFVFAEKWFGPGGSFTFILIAGVAIAILSLMYAFGTLQTLLDDFLAPFSGNATS